MRLRSVVGGLAAGAVGTAAANRALRKRAAPLPPPLVGEQDTYRWRGFDVEYTVAGEDEDPDVLFLHGVHAAASAQEFDRVFDLLCESHRVVAPDLPGFGRSDRPPVRYSGTLYEEFVASFAEDVTEDATCIATSPSGAYAAANCEAFSELVLVCPTDDTGPGLPLLGSLFRTPLLGEGLFNLLTSRPSLRYFDQREGYHGTADDATLDYQYRSAHQSGARFAPAAFVGGALDPEEKLGALLADCEVPVTLVWGREASRPPLAVGRALAEQVDARLLVVDDARLLPHAEHPEAFLDGLDL
jgi:pimeloyl-ACP methyl ester carboxylesterase